MPRNNGRRGKSAREVFTTLEPATTKSLGRVAAAAKASIKRVRTAKSIPLQSEATVGNSLSPKAALFTALIILSRVCSFFEPCSWRV